VIAAVFYCKYYITADVVIENNVAFITLAFAQLFHVFNMSSSNAHLLLNEITKNKFIWIALLICTLLMLMVYIVPQMRQALGLVILPAKIWIVCILAALIPLVMVQSFKIITKYKTTKIKKDLFK
jgi:Ca2+-transporting ATPase